MLTRLVKYIRHKSCPKNGDGEIEKRQRRWDPKDAVNVGSKAITETFFSEKTVRHPRLKKEEQVLDQSRKKLLALVARTSFG